MDREDHYQLNSMIIYIISFAPKTHWFICIQMNKYIIVYIYTVFQR